MKTAAAYIRVSTEDQIEYSPESQLKNIKKYALAHGYELLEEYVFVDEGISGKGTKKRSQFNRMISLAKCKPKPFDAILLWKFSRFARNREDSVVYKSLLRKQLGIDVISISEALGDDKMSILIEALIEAMDEYYSINLAEEVRRGMKERAGRGGAVTAPAFGYRMANGCYIIEPGEAEAVKLVYEGFAQGKTPSELARFLNLMGFTTKHGNPWETRTVKYMLQNPVYQGKIRWNAGQEPEGKKGSAIVVPGVHKAIVSGALFNQVQSLLSLNKRAPYVNQSNPYLVRGLIYCSSCGGPMTMLASGKSLQCARYAKGKCKVSHSVTLLKLDRLVIKSIEAAFGKLEITLPAEGNKKALLPDSLSCLRQAELKLSRIRRAYETGIYTLEEYRESKETIERDILFIKNESSVSFAPLQPETVCLSDFFKDNTISIQKKNALLRVLCEKIIFDREQSRCDIVFRCPDDKAITAGSKDRRTG